MKLIPFVKYTSCGNNFVIVDETEQSILSEAEKSRFAFQATNTSFGVGCDNLLVIQRSSADVLKSIATERNYWQHVPDKGHSDFLFRMFEPDGEEALCCGNGLICVAGYLAQAHGIRSASIMTEVPLPHPRSTLIGSGDGDMDGWVDLGHPRKAPIALATPEARVSLSESIDTYTDLSIRFRATDLSFFTEETELKLKAYLVFTGEPHLVIFPDQDFSLPELADFIFGSSVQWSVQDRRESFGTWLVEHIGNQLNSRFRNLFPSGINVNLARILETGVIENRCFERGVNRETLACGTGALAVAYLYSYLFNPELKDIEVYPHRCRWHDDEAKITIHRSANGWKLVSRPVMLFDGHYRLLPENNRLVSALKHSEEQVSSAESGELSG